MSESTPSSNRLEELTVECFEILQVDGESAAERFCIAHPEHADAIRESLDELRRVALLPDRLDQRGAIFGDFRLLERIGQGGMGVVYRAEQKSLGREVALKLMRRGILVDDRARQRFKREVEALSKLDHAAICTVYEAGEIDGTPYLAMRLIDGGSLAEAIAARRALAAVGDSGSSVWRDVLGFVEIVEKVARAVHVAHESGLLHRDIKPANILLDGDGEPVLVDFGLVSDNLHPSGAITVTGQQIGTPAYMAPEQVDPSHCEAGSLRTPATDVHALGVTLYECLTLRHPFHVSNREELYRRILTQAPPKPNQFNRHIDRDLRAILECAMHKEPSRRYTTALDFAEELRRWRTHESIVTRRPSLIQRGMQWSRRNPAPTGVLIATALGLGVSLYFLFESRRSEREFRTIAMLREADQSTDPILSFKLSREALRLGSEKALAVVQQAMFRLREHSELDPGIGRIVRLVISPDEQYFIAASGSGRAALYTADGTLVQGDLVCSPLHRPPVAFSSDSSRLAVGTERGALVFSIDRRGAKEIDKLETERRVHDVDFSPDDSKVLVGMANAVKLWSLANNEVIDLRDNTISKALTFLPDGRFVARASLWSSDAANSIALEGAPQGLFHVDVCGDKILSASFDSLFVHDLQARLCWKNEQLGRIAGIQVHQATRTVVTVSMTGHVRLFALDDGHLRAAWTTNVVGTPSSVCILKSAPRVCVGTARGAVRVYDFNGIECDAYDGHQGVITALASIGSGSLYSATWNGHVRVWNQRASRAVPALRDLGRPNLAISGTQIAIATSRGWLMQCDEDATVLARCPIDQGSALLSVRRDGASLIAAQANRKAYFWDKPVEGSAWPDRARPWRVPFELRSAPLHLDRDHILLHKKEDRRLVLLSSGKPMRKLVPDGVNPRDEAAAVECVAASSDGRIATGSWDAGIRVFELSGRIVWQDRLQAGGLPLKVRFVDREQGLLVTSNTGWAFAFDLQSGERSDFGPHQSPVTDAVIVTTSRGDRVVTATRDGRVVVFDRASRRRLLVLAGHETGTLSMEVTKSGKLVTAGSDGSIRVWCLDRESLLRQIERLEVAELTESEHARFKDLLR